MTNFRPAPGVRWVLEGDGIVLIHPALGSLRLTGVSATLWALVTSGREREKVREMMAAISGETPETTEARMERLLTLWEGKGYLARRCPDG